MYKKKAVEQDWTIQLLEEVMRQTGMNEAELCHKAQQSDDWLTRLKSREEEATLQDCFVLASALGMSLHEFFIRFDEEEKNKTCQMTK